MIKNKIAYTVLVASLALFSAQTFAGTAETAKSEMSAGLTTAQVTALIVKNHGVLSGVDVSTTKDHVVILSGKVNSESEAKQLVEATAQIHGVKDVDTNGLEVIGSDHPMKDAYITAKVIGKLMGTAASDKHFSNSDISVETAKGIAYLSMAKGNRNESTAVNIAKSVDGVSEVKVIYLPADKA